MLAPGDVKDACLLRDAHTRYWNELGERLMKRFALAYRPPGKGFCVRRGRFTLDGPHSWSGRCEIETVLLILARVEL